MIIDHPLLGPRDSEEFVYLGSTDLIDRPTNWESSAAAEDFHQYQYIRENIENILNGISNIKVLVIGDIMLDNYIIFTKNISIKSFV